jgi:short-subunit dehydrogenase
MAACWEYSIIKKISMALKHKNEFANKVVTVTGASAGIGRAIALAFAKQGAHIGLISRNEERLQTLAKEIEQYNVSTVILPLDVSDANAVEKAAAQVETQLGPIDIWVNNAMVSVFSPVKEMKPDEYKRVTEVTYLGTAYGTLAALKYMLVRNAGTIIQVGSALAYRGIPLQSAYCAAKHAVQGFHDSLLSELLHDKSKVKVTMVQLSAHNTPQFDWVRSRLKNKAQPVPPIYQPEVAARAVLWAAKHYRREYIVGFPSWKAIYGNNFFPSYGDKFLAKNGYESQETNEPEDKTRGDNLFQAMDGPFGSHGRFDRKAIDRDKFFELTKRIPFNFLLLGAVFLIVIFLILAI